MKCWIYSPVAVSNLCSEQISCFVRIYYRNNLGKYQLLLYSSICIIHELVIFIFYDFVCNYLVSLSKTHSS